MSRVTINDLAWDYKHNTMQKELIESQDIEIVPRKMVEIIIEKCKDHASGPKPSIYIAGVSDEAELIAKYAESLLKQFEEDDSSNTESSNAEKCSVEPLPFEF